MDVNQYLEIFLDETNEHIQSLSDQLMNLEQEPDNPENNESATPRLFF